MEGVTIVDHPLVGHKLTLMRDKRRSTKGFRQLLNEIGKVLVTAIEKKGKLNRRVRIGLA